MPVKSEYHSSAWFVDPEDQNLYRIVGDSISDESITMQELTDGSLGISSTSIYDADTGRFRFILDPTRPTQLSVMSTGQLIASRESAPSNANAPTPTASRYGATGTAEVVLPNGAVMHTVVSPWVSGEGNRVMIREASQPGDDVRYRVVSLFDAAGQAVEPEVPVGWRYATPEESLNRGLTAELAKTRTDELREMIALGMVDENGEPVTDVYEAAMYVAHQMQITPSLSSVVM